MPRAPRDDGLEKMQRELRKQNRQNRGDARPDAGLEQAVERLGEVPKPHVGRDAGEEQVHVAPPPAQQDRRRDGQRQRSAKEHRAVSKIHARA